MCRRNYLPSFFPTTSLKFSHMQLRKHCILPNRNGGWKLRWVSHDHPHPLLLWRIVNNRFCCDDILRAAQKSSVRWMSFASEYNSVLQSHGTTFENWFSPSMNWSQAIKFGVKYIYLLSHLTGSSHFIFNSPFLRGLKSFIFNTIPSSLPQPVSFLVSSKLVWYCLSL